MTRTHEALMRAAVALQVAVIEHADEQLGEHAALAGVQAAANEIAKLVKQLKRED